MLDTVSYSWRTWVAIESISLSSNQARNDVGGWVRVCARAYACLCVCTHVEVFVDFLPGLKEVFGTQSLPLGCRYCPSRECVEDQVL